MRSFEFCEYFPPFGGRSGTSSDPRWASRLIENFTQEGGQGGLPLGSLPLWGRKGGTLTTTTEDFLNNSYIEDFYRVVFLTISHIIFVVAYCLPEKAKLQTQKGCTIFYRIIILINPGIIRLRK
jgi:hypothetical protein